MLLGGILEQSETYRLRINCPEVPAWSREESLYLSNDAAQRSRADMALSCYVTSTGGALRGPQTVTHRTFLMTEGQSSDCRQLGRSKIDGPTFGDRRNLLLVKASGSNLSSSNSWRMISTQQRSRTYASFAQGRPQPDSGYLWMNDLVVEVRSKVREPRRERSPVGIFR